MRLLLERGSQGGATMSWIKCEKCPNKELWEAALALVLTFILLRLTG